eukprot:COSAG05_NODE_1092_length_5914_cov_16.615305_1_plen_803_part_00
MAAPPEPAAADGGGVPLFPTPFMRYDYDVGDPPKTLHEMKLMEFEGAVCDKPGWFSKVNNEAIVARWRVEAPLLSDNDFEFCIRELRWRAERWATGPSRPAAVEGVFSADDLLPAPQLSSLKAAVAQLEAIQGDAIDWHPGSNQQVRDLVHPSLFCYRRGITPEVAAPAEVPETLAAAQLTRSIGSGQPKPQTVEPEPPADRGGRRRRAVDPMKSEDGLVWLPSEFSIRADGSVDINSYINQLDPKQCPMLYTAVSDAFGRLVPLLEDVLTVSACGYRTNWEKEIQAAREKEQRLWQRQKKKRTREQQAGEASALKPDEAAEAEEEDSKDSDDERGPDIHTAGRVSVGGLRAVIKIEGIELPRYMTRGQTDSTNLPPRYESPIWIDPAKNELTEGGYYDEEFYYDSEDGEEHERTEENPGPPPPSLIQPCTPAASDYVPPDPAPERLRVSLRGKGVQVITKIASIHLTPEQPRYDGGAWHVEGMVDDGIVATAICYFEQDNITESGLAFRAAVSEPAYAQGDTQGVEQIFGLVDGEALSQSRGLCTTSEGRCLAWPNTLQHQVQPFELQDATKPGYRKILCFFLVDPNKRIPSTLTCPPQQAEWMKRELLNMPPFFRLPKEVFSRILTFVTASGPAGGEPEPDYPYPPLATTEATDYEDWIVRVLGLEHKRERDCQACTVGSLLTALWPDGAHRGFRAQQPVWALQRQVVQFDDELTNESAALIAAAATQVATALWLQGKPEFLQLDKRDTRSSLSRNGLVAPLLGQEDAEMVREILMAERGKIGKNWQGESFERQFSLCEH